MKIKARYSMIKVEITKETRDFKLLAMDKWIIIYNR